MTDPRYTATYGNEDVDVYDAPDSVTKPLIVYVHGGAWRAENKEQHRGLAVRVRDATGFPVAVVDYRLTTADNDVKHPAHAKDVLDALHFLIAWPDDAPFDRTRLYLVGHSAGAHMLTSIFLDAAGSFTPLPAANNYLRPSDGLLGAVRGIALASGIYDLVRLVGRFPGYDARYVRPAFREPYEFWETTRYPLHARTVAARASPPPRWYVVHSTGDMHVDVAQSLGMYEHLAQLYAEEGWEEARIRLDVTTLTAPHDYTGEPEFVQMIGEWVAKDMRDY